MEIIIILALLLVAGAMLFGKPLQIIIKHEYKAPETQVPSQLTEAERKQEQEAQASMDTVLRTIKEFMGVETDGDNDRTT